MYVSPLLFNFYINGVVRCPDGQYFHPPKVGGCSIALLLYADAAAVLSRTPTGLKGALRTLVQYCNKDNLDIHYQKNKIMAFAKKPKLHLWSINDNKTEHSCHCCQVNQLC